MSTFRDKLKMGYLYQIGDNIPAEPGERCFIACTGYGGAIQYGEALESAGIPDELIQESISIAKEETIVSGQVWTPISRIHWVKTIEDTEP